MAVFAKEWPLGVILRKVARQLKIHLESMFLQESPLKPNSFVEPMCEVHFQL